ncbi:MAG TPA: FG-GAP repeat protein [Verrucomicrobiales bacterium]|nr:FG-GAP repeat protein [Verrucomicrobiales bacterium]
MIRFPMKSALFFLLAATKLLAVTEVKVGDHPTSRLTPFPSILSLHVHGGRVYMGYGTNTDFYPPVFIVSYDPALNAFHLEHSAATDELNTFRTIGGTLYAAHNDPSHYEDFRDYSYRGADGIWRDATPAGCLHVYDFASAGGSLFFCGSKPPVEGASGIGVIMGSGDGGESWNIAKTGVPDRVYWCYGLGNRLYHSSGALENGKEINPGGAYGNTKTLSLTLKGQPLAIHMGNASVINGLTVFDGAAASTLHPWAHLRALDQNTLYSVFTDMLTGKYRVYRAAWFSAQGAVWEETPVELSSSNISSFAVLGGRAYFGVGDGSLRAANLDGTPLVLPAPTVRNDLPDSFGRGLASSGLLLACGAPDTFSTQAAAGAAQIFQESDGAAGWLPVKSFAPPTPRLSGWFGKDLAVNGDVMAVVETGYDTSGRERGKDARIHVYQSAGGTWPSRTILSLPYAHSAALLPDFLAIATANPASSQSAGQPGVTPYRITRGANGTISINAQTQLKPVLQDWGYKPACRVVMSGDLLVGGFAGDPSRAGGQGMVSIWRRVAAGTSFDPAPEQEFSDKGPNHFGYAIALDGLWLAVGAPRDDTAASQAGAVHLYKRDTLTAPFVKMQTLAPPVAQNEAAFGSALALRGGTLLAGAPGVTAGGVKHRGATYVFRRGADDAWAFSAEMPRPAASLAEFGVEVAMTETHLVAASRLSDNAAPAMQKLSFLPHPEPTTLFDLWRAENGVTGTSDTDGDGLSDLIEYAVNLKPLAPDSATFDHLAPEPLFGTPQYVIDGSPPLLHITWLQRTDDPRLTTQLEYSTDLESWYIISAAQSEAVLTGARFTVRSSTLPVPADSRQYVRQTVRYDSVP